MRAAEEKKVAEGAGVAEGEDVRLQVVIDLIPSPVSSLTVIDPYT